MTARLLTCKDVAEILQISPAKSYAMAKTGEIPSVNFGRLVRVHPDDLEGFISENRVSKDKSHKLIGQTKDQYQGGK
jgi:excisionase family DNA binding protein